MAPLLPICTTLKKIIAVCQNEGYTYATLHLIFSISSIAKCTVPATYCCSKFGQKTPHFLDFDSS